MFKERYFSRKESIMTKKDIAFIKKIIGNAEYTPVMRLVSCYVDTAHDDIRFQEPQTFLCLDESELVQYCQFFKKGVSGKLGSTVMELDVKKNLIESLRSTSLSDLEEIKSVAMTIRDNYTAEENYCIFFAYGSYDLPGYDGNDSEEVYPFLLILIQPCCLSKPGIKYDSPKNEFTNRMAEPILNPPTYTFLYPALDALHTDVSKAVFYSKNEKVSGKAGQIISTLFGTEIPLSPNSQKEGFHDLLQNAYNENVPYESICGIYDRLQETLVDMQLSGEDVKFSNDELVNTIIEYGSVPEKKREQLKESAAEYEGCSFSISNLVPSKVNIDTGGISIKTEIERLSQIERRVIDGVEYYLIPANSSSIDDILLANTREK